VELLFVILLAAGLGFLAHYTIPGREARGALLLGSLAAVVATVVWEALLWLGFTFDGGWIWLISLVAGGLAGLIAAIVLPRRRREDDRALLTKLSGGKA
jgi:uncharacterized membrane protein YeaQ/YmgE (transglycosylase-associated protein family)